MYLADSFACIDAGDERLTPERKRLSFLRHLFPPSSFYSYESLSAIILRYKLTVTFTRLSSTQFFPRRDNARRYALAVVDYPEEKRNTTVVTFVISGEQMKVASHFFVVSLFAVTVHIIG